MTETTFWKQSRKTLFEQLSATDDGSNGQLDMGRCGPRCLRGGCRPRRNA
jgi:hypothetical protein